jgi:hypothetical protein
VFFTQCALWIPQHGRLSRGARAAPHRRRRSGRTPPAGPADRLHGVFREDAETVPFLGSFQGRRGLTLAPVGRRAHATQVELARRLCAAYVSFRMRTRGIDSVLHHMPKKISNFWIELARLVTLQRRRSAPDQNNEVLTRERSVRRDASAMATSCQSASHRARHAGGSPRPSLASRGLPPLDRRGGAVVTSTSIAASGVSL